jgi:hypothetical protein
MFFTNVALDIIDYNIISRFGPYVPSHCGTGTTMIASLRYGRNSIGIDIEPEYCRITARFLKKESSNLFFKTELFFERMIFDYSGHLQVREDQALYEVKSARKIMA